MDIEAPIRGVEGARLETTQQVPSPALGDSVARQRTLLDIFRQTATRWPLRTALEAPDGTYSYAELSEAAGELAWRLHTHGIGRGDRVAVRVSSGRAELYIAILGVLLAGAAYVPIDAEDPAERVHHILQSSVACATVADGLKFELHRKPTLATVNEPTPDDDAWVIFTSGTTGVPKGVAVTHRSAAAFVDAESRLWEVLPQDRVLAGLSVGFDASCEEIWLAWAHGAALIPAPRAVVRAGEELGNWLVDRGVTVVSTVPTLAALWDESCLHRVRLLILGGEACPEKLGWRLAAGREVWNTYGPTEATVVSTACRIIPGEPITIGLPLEGWEVAVMEGDHPVESGESGELVIGGVGLARYLDPELDAARFAGIPTLGWERAYRTGDIVRLTAGGLSFLGRRDDQVKIGGRRIELGEVEAMLQSAPGVSVAAVAVRESVSGNKLLVGYIVGDADSESVRHHAARHLPAAMVPLVVNLPSMPMSAAGKVDRRALPWPVGDDQAALAAGIGADGTVLSEHEVWVGQQWAAQIGPVPIGPNTDFFACGGTSLAAAKLISSVRSRYPAVAVADIYKNPTLRTFAQRLHDIAAPARAEAVESLPGRRLFALAQLAGMIVLFAIGAVPWLLATLAYGDIFPLGTPHVGWLWLVAAYALLASPPAHAGMHVLAARSLLSKVTPGRHSRYSSLTWRLWFVERLAEVCHGARLGGTPWADRYARLLGAKVGEGARLGSMPSLGALLTVGPGATIEGNVDLHGWMIEGEQLVVGPITVGADARIGTRTLLSPGAVVGAGAEIEPGSVVQGVVPERECWSGVPAVAVGTAGVNWPAQPPQPSHHARGLRLMFALSLPLEALLGTLAAAPATLLIYLLGGFAPTPGRPLLGIMVEIVCEVVITVPVFALLVALTLRFVWRFVKPGWYPEYEAVGWALWFSEELRGTAATYLFPLYASLYTRAWLRLMGLQVGRRTEVSTSTGLSPMVSFGAYSQSTDDVGFCCARARGGWIHVAPVTVGDRSFLGPGAVLKGDTRMGDRSLLGVLTLAPRQIPEGTSWFGVPALELPRQPDFCDVSRTTDPPRRLILARGVMDLVRLFLPNTIALTIGAGEIFAMAEIFRVLGPAAAVILAPLVLLAGAVCATVITVILKWIVIGHYRRGEHPLWSWFVWRDELINSAQEQLAGSLLGNALGTPLMSLYLRALGARVGRGVWLESLAVTEYEMITLGDGVAVNRGACLMTHLFHDRLLRIGPTELQAGATLGPTAAVLPDTMIGVGTSVAGHSVVLRGEELPSGTRWQGAPVVAC